MEAYIPAISAVQTERYVIPDKLVMIAFMIIINKFIYFFHYKKCPKPYKQASVKVWGKYEMI